MDTYVKFNNQTSGKDKIFRLCQYTSRIVWYSLEKRQLSPNAVEKAKHLDGILGLMRQLLRFGRFLDACQSTFSTISISDSVIRITTSLSRISNASFLFIDHVTCLHKLGLLPAKMIIPSKWDDLSTKFWLYSILLGLFRDFYDILRIYKEEFQVKFRTLKVRDNFNRLGPSSSLASSSSLSSSVSTSSFLKNSSGGGHVLGSSTTATTSSSSSSASSSSSTQSFLNHQSAAMVKYIRQVKVVSNCVLDHADVAVDTVKNLCDLFIPLNSLGVVKLTPSTIGLLGVISTIVSAIPQINPMIKMVPAS